MEKKVNENVLRFQQQAKAYNDAIKALELAKTFADKFDGKVINKRFTTTLNEAAKTFLGNQVVNFSLHYSGYNCTMEQNIIELEIYLYDRYKCYEGGCVYIDDDRLRVYSDYRQYKAYIDEDSRLNKDLFIKAINTTIDIHHNLMERYQYCADNFDDIMNKIIEENKRIEAFKKEIPSPMHIFL